MFTDDFSDDWDTTEAQNAFIKQYFNKGKVSSSEINANGKRASHSIEKHTAQNSKRKCMNEDNVNIPNDSCGVSYNETKETSRSKSNKKRKKRNHKAKELTDVSLQDNNVDKEEGHESHKKISSNSELNSPVVKKKKKKSKNKRELHVELPEKNNSGSTVCPAETSHVSSTDSNQLSSRTFLSGSCNSARYQKLQAAKFRYLNELLYTKTGKDAYSYFRDNSDEFEDYHTGYQVQVSKWPVNPVDIIIQEIEDMNETAAVIADLGCGAAKIAKAFSSTKTVHSFDLVALEKGVIECDMAKVPLPGNSVDVAVFCLSLMGTNWKDYVQESYRILKPGGILKIAEIESRIDNLDHFIKNIERFGYSLLDQNASHKMFIFLNFEKTKKNKKLSKVPLITLKPCLYKKR